MRSTRSLRSRNTALYAQKLAQEFASCDAAKRLTELVEAVVAEREVLIG